MSILLRRWPFVLRPLRWFSSAHAGASTALGRLQRDLDLAVQQARHCLDLSGHDPASLAEVRLASLLALAPHVDHLILPAGCTVNTVLRWTRSLALRSLTAYGVVPHHTLRDQDLPPSIVLVRGDDSLLPADDVLRSTRLLHLRGPAAPAAPSLPHARSLTATAPVTVQDWLQAQALADRCLARCMRAATSAAQTSEKDAPRLTADEVIHIAQVLRSFPAALLPVRGRLACELTLAQLTDETAAVLTASQARQLHIAVTQARFAAIVPSPTGLAVADGADLQWLHLLRGWTDAGPTAAERREREAGVERDLMLRHQQLVAYTLDVLKPTSPSVTPAAAPTAAPSAASLSAVPAQWPSPMATHASEFITAQPSTLITVGSSRSSRAPSWAHPAHAPDRLDQPTVRCSAFKLRPRPGKAFRYLNVPVA